MDAINSIVDRMNNPTFSQWLRRSFEPEYQAWLIPGADEVGISIAVRVTNLTVNQPALSVRIQRDFSPLGGHQQARGATGMENYVDAAVTREVSRHTGTTMSTRVHSVLDPIGSSD
jgi:hypothetical protein